MLWDLAVSRAPGIKPGPMLVTDYWSLKQQCPVKCFPIFYFFSIKNIAFEKCSPFLWVISCQDVNIHLLLPGNIWLNVCGVVAFCTCSLGTSSFKALACSLLFQWFSWLIYWPVLDFLGGKHSLFNCQWNLKSWTSSFHWHSKCPSTGFNVSAFILRCIFISWKIQIIL